MREAKPNFFYFTYLIKRRFSQLNGVFRNYTAFFYAKIQPNVFSEFFEFLIFIKDKIYLLKELIRAKSFVYIRNITVSIFKFTSKKV